MDVIDRFVTSRQLTAQVGGSAGSQLDATCGGIRVDDRLPRLNSRRMQSSLAGSPQPAASDRRDSASTRRRRAACPNQAPVRRPLHPRAGRRRRDQRSPPSRPGSPAAVHVRARSSVLPAEAEGCNRPRAASAQSRCYRRCYRCGPTRPTRTRLPALFWLVRGCVGRGGVEPPTFRFSGQTPQRCSDLRVCTILTSAPPTSGSPSNGAYSSTATSAPTHRCLPQRLSENRYRPEPRWRPWAVGSHTRTPPERAQSRSPRPRIGRLRAWCNSARSSLIRLPWSRRGGWVGAIRRVAVALLP
jgi:hypothetical protein